MQNQNKVILITGAAGGIGKALVEVLLGERDENQPKAHKVVVIQVDKEKFLPSNLGEPKKSTAVKFTYQADLADSNQIYQLAENVTRDHPKIDVLVNNAGIGVYKKISDLSLEEWEKSLSVNVTAPFLLTKLFLNNMTEKPLILNIGSGCGKYGVAERSAYCASKFGLRGLSLSLSKELAPEVNVVYLTLGSVATDFGDHSAQEKLCSEKKKYFTTREVAEYICQEIIFNSSENLPPEIELYPNGYLETIGQHP